MSQLKLSGDASGTGIVTVAAPNTNSTYTVNLPAAAGTLARTDAAQTFTGVQTFSSDASINGLTVGRGAGAVSTNTAVGASALAANASGVQNNAFGNLALTSVTSNGYNDAFGYTALQYNTGAANAAFGNSAMRGVNGSSTGGSNAAFGASALLGLTTGANNVAVGTSALQANTTASNNTAVGYQALYASNRTADTNGYNTAIGYGSGSAITTGQKNTIIGAYNGNQGGLDIRTASNYIVLSDGGGVPAAVRGAYPAGASWTAFTNAWTFGNGGTSATGDGQINLNGASATNRGAALVGFNDGTYAWATGSYSVVVGGTSVFYAIANSGGGGVYLNGTSATSWTAVSDERQKENLVEITDAANKVSTLRSVIGNYTWDAEKTARPFLIAQDVQKVLPEAVTESVDKEGNEQLGVAYTDVIPLLVAAIKELKSELDTVKAELAALKGV